MEQPDVHDNAAPAVAPQTCASCGSAAFAVTAVVTTVDVVSRATKIRTLTIRRDFLFIWLAHSQAGVQVGQGRLSHPSTVDAI